MSYSVGQTLFLLARKDKKVIPVRVVEEIVRKTIEDKIVSYNVLLPDKAETVASLSDIDAEVFVSVFDLRQKMINTATSMIDDLINRSKSVAEKKFGYEEKPDRPTFSSVDLSVHEDEVPVDQVSNKKEEDFSNAEVDLGNGLKARVSSSVL
tara:strand:+ start:44 stop:499 length:456 start_codon:yes stop_codon:yes gene_type:complete